MSPNSVFQFYLQVLKWEISLTIIAAAIAKLSVGSC